MKRREFSTKTKAAAFERCKGLCEGKDCGVKLTTGRFHYDHDLADGLGGEPTLANCRVLCTACHDPKTAKRDVPRIAKMKRQQAAHIGAKAEPAQPMQSRNDLPPRKPRKEFVDPFPDLPRPRLFRTIA